MIMIKKMIMKNMKFMKNMKNKMKKQNILNLVVKIKNYQIIFNHWRYNIKI